MNREPRGWPVLHGKFPEIDAAGHCSGSRKDDDRRGHSSTGLVGHKKPGLAGLESHLYYQYYQQTPRTVYLYHISLTKIIFKMSNSAAREDEPIDVVDDEDVENVDQDEGVANSDAQLRKYYWMDNFVHYSKA